MSSDALKKKKISEAQAKVALAEKSLVKSFFKKPDHEKAAGLYESAAMNYKVAKEYESAKAAWMKAADCQYEERLPFSAARDLERAAEMCRELSRPTEAASLYERAAIYYREDGKPDKAADALTAGAALIEAADAADATRLYVEALELFAAEDKDYKANATFKAAIAHCARHRQFDECVRVLRMQASSAERLGHNSDVHKSFTSIVVCHLARDDPVAARRFYDETMASDVSAWLVSEQGQLAGALLTAVEDDDADALANVADQQIVHFLDNQVAKLAKQIKVSGSGRKKGSEDVAEAGNDGGDLL